MPHRMLNKEEVASYLHVTPTDVDRLLREGDIPHSIRGGRVFFLRGEIDAWASKRILGLPPRRLDAYHQRSLPGTEAALQSRDMVPELMRTDYIDLNVTSKTRASVIRDMAELADRTGRVNDRAELVDSIESREELCSTALPGGFALLHARALAPYRFEGSFIVLGRTLQAVPFGAPDGRPTRLFFLLCCQDERIHLHALARICMMAQKTGLISELLLAQDPEFAYSCLLAAEQAVLPNEAEQDDA